MSKKFYNIQALFDQCLELEIHIPSDIKNAADNIIDYREKQRGVLTVIITGLVYKYFHPEQDVRYHQSNMTNGYSGRSFDSKYITPFLREKDFPCMSESGWLTRSLEQNIPYVRGYPGKISGNGLKDSFLFLYDVIENYRDPVAILAYMFQQLIKKRDESKINLSVPANLTVIETFTLMKKHFEYPYQDVTGASRLPNIAIYSAYKAIIEDSSKRYNRKTLCNLDSHTASDKSTGSIGDVQINNEYNQPFEGIEIKARKITPEMIDIVYSKIQAHSTVERYYLLSTQENIEQSIIDIINSKISKIRIKHGCELIVNGVYTTLKYFLRLVDTKMFMEFYTKQVDKDDALKYEHKLAWNIICTDL